MTNEAKTPQAAITAADIASRARADLDAANTTFIPASLTNVMETSVAFMEAAARELAELRAGVLTLVEAAAHAAVVDTKPGA